jgi:trypsin
MFASIILTLSSIALVNGANITPFISNGNQAEIAEFPFLVSIQHIDVHVCAGSLLNKKWILSAARCFVRPVNELIIEYGSSTITPGVNGGTKLNVSRTIMHENFNSTSLVNNIGLAEARGEISTGWNEPFVKLIVSGARFVSGTQSVHAGWGHVGPNVRNNQLQKAYIDILSDDECAKAVADTQRPERRNICAMAESVICNGDLGNSQVIITTSGYHF